ncbi:YgcG family protein [Acaryochloris marina]|uniref:TPM domain-containing protein n=1 Tax=Acaryochloris marina TaxID=155978 RepID=UPI001BAF48C1|nr:TPM domain-containing protein [Acaryochloris marina]QUY43702.1 TPM domain-containing protein [Acaryochloris marina S15]
MFLTRLKKRESSLLTFILALSFSLFLSISSLTPSRAIPVSEVPNPRQDNHWVMDSADILSQESEAKLNQIIVAKAKHSFEVIVVTVPDIKPSASLEEFAASLFETWEIGKHRFNNGILLLISKDDLRAEIQRGEGVQLILPDARVDNIIQTQINPYLEQREFDEGIVNGTQTVLQILENEIQKYRQERTLEDYGTPLSYLPDPFMLEMEIAIRDMAWFLITSVLSSIAIAVLVMTPAVVLMSLFRKSQVLQLSPVGRTTLFKQGSRLRLMWGSITYWLLTGYASVYPEQPTSIYKGMHFTNPLIQSWWILFGLYSAVGVTWSFVHPVQMNQFQGFLLCWLGVWLGYELWYCVKHKDPRGSEAMLLFRGLFRSSLVAFTLVLIVARVFKVPGFETALIFYLITAFSGAWAGMLLLLRSLTRYTEVRCQSCHGLMQCLDSKTVDSYLKPAETAAKMLKSTRYVGWECPTCSFVHPESDFNIRLFHEVVKSEKFGHCSECEAYVVRQTIQVLRRPRWFTDGETLITSRCVCCDQTSESHTNTPSEFYQLMNRY